MPNAHWENPEVTAIGRLAARANFKHKKTQKLNGLWQFKRLAHPSEVTPRHWSLNCKDGRWQQITVPSLWTRSREVDTPDKPIYTNVRMPFRGEPPLAPSNNPTAIYRRNFKLADTWFGKTSTPKRTVIHFGGVENCFYLYCNGQEVGFAKDCRLPSEFDLSDYVQAGDNQLTIVVIKYSDSSYIEDQDQWWHAGIHPDVYLYQTEAVYIADLFVKPSLDPNDNSAALSINVSLGGEHRTMLEHTIEAQLYGPIGSSTKPVFKKTLAEKISKPNFYAVTGKGPHLSLGSNIKKVSPWTSETPALYQLVVGLRDTTGSLLQEVTINIGFRDVRIENKQLLVNNQAVLIRGVNRHDHCETSGKVMTEKLMRLDIETMKAHNINAVRTSHYPNDVRFYELCDEYGLYVVDECNLEAHHHYAQLGHLSYWTNAFMSRITRMVERDKNHPCIIMWSMGNETGYGANAAAMASWCRSFDPSRPIHNESAICIKGGFIWEWIDHGLKEEKDGEAYWAYGGDYNEDIHDLNFVCDGLCWPDRMPHSSLLEFKQVVRPVVIIRLKSNRFSICNKHEFIDLSIYDISWQLLLNGYPIGRERHLKKLKTAALHSETVELDIKMPALQPGDELSILFQSQLRQDQPWADKGHIVATDQMILKSKAKLKLKYAKLNYDQSIYALHFGNNTVTLDNSGIVNWQHGKQTVMTSGPKLNIWRAPLDNDGIKGWGGQTNKALGRWLEAGVDQPAMKHKLISVTKKQIVTESRAICKTGQVIMTSHYQVTEDNKLAVKHQFEIDAALDDLPRIGVSMILNEKFNRLSWYGHGPVESYCDRQEAAILRQHESTVTEQYVPYILPQAHGNHTEVRQMEFKNKQLKFEIDNLYPCEMSASHYSEKQLFEAFHTTDLTPNNEIYLTMDAKQRGVGGASCGSDTLEQYRVKAGSYALSYVLDVASNK